MSSETLILHVDMDAFYASVEQRDRPELRGQPVIVGGSAESRGVVSAASYEARAFGVHSAMPTAVARRLCPHAVFLPVRMGVYARVSKQVLEVLGSFTPQIEPLSLDEAFLDVRGCDRLFGSPHDIARSIKARIRADTQLTASVGVAPNKFLAKLASDLKKPDGLVVIEAARVAETLAPLPVSRLWGVGQKGEARLHQLGLHTIGQIAALPEQILADHFGPSGRHLWQLAHGLDARPVVPDAEAKSISTETTFAHDLENRHLLRHWLLDLVDQLAQRIRAQGVRARTVEIKVRSSDFRTCTRTVTLPDPTDATEMIWQAAAGLFDQRVPDEFLPLRLVGVGVSGLTQRDSPAQGHLFDEPERLRHQAIDRTLDAIRAQFGDTSVRRAGTLDRPQTG